MRRKTVEELQHSGTWTTLTKAEQQRRLALETVQPFEFGMPPRPVGLSPRERRWWDHYTSGLLAKRLLAKSDQSLVLQIIKAKLLDDDEELAAAVAVLQSRAPFPEQAAQQEVEVEVKPVLEIPDAAATAKSYAASVLDGTIVAGKYVKLACKRFLNDLQRQDIRFDATAAQHVINYLERLGIALLPWQCFALANLYGFRKQDGYRRFRRGQILISKKQGKSTLAAGLTLYHADEQGDGEPYADCYIGATGKSQASDICYKMCCRLRQDNPWLASRSRKWQSKITFGAGGLIEPLCAASEHLQGRNLAFGILDEEGDMKDATLHDTFTSSTAARRQPLVLSISTAGAYREGQICWEERKHGVQVVEGVIPDDAGFYLYYELDTEDDWQDEKNWVKSNPSIGHTVMIDGIRDLYQQPSGIPSKLNAFRRYSLNIWPSVHEQSWIDASHLEAAGVAFIDEADKNLTPKQRCEKAEKRLEIVKPTRPLSDLSDAEFYALRAAGVRQSYAGLDLAQTTDLSAACLLFPPPKPDGIFECLFRVWLPHDGLMDKAKNDRVPYDVWQRAGFLSTTPGSVTDTTYIEAELLKWKERFGIKELGFDRKYAEDLCRRLENAGVRVTALRQGFDLSPAIVKVQQLIATHKICLHGNPIANWNFSNGAVVVGPITGDLRLEKVRARNRIDAVAACVMAMQVYMLQKPGNAWGGGEMRYI
jgi:phage terminase large subunit-like protein